MLRFLAHFPALVSFPARKQIEYAVRQDVRWTYAVHEHILAALQKANVPVRWSEVTVRHTGYTDPVLRERKLERDPVRQRQPDVLSFSQGGFKRHHQSRSDKETALNGNRPPAYRQQGWLMSE